MRLANHPGQISDLNPTNSDLVVDQWSQRNADDELDYPNAGVQGYTFHAHTFGGILPQGMHAQSQSTIMSVTGEPGVPSIQEMLSRPGSSMNSSTLY